MLTKPSLTLKRKLKASPAQVFSAWADPKKIVHWFGPNETQDGSVQAEMDVRPGGRYRLASRPKTVNITRSAASTARWSPTTAWSLRGPGIPHPSASRS